MPEMANRTNPTTAATARSVSRLARLTAALALAATTLVATAPLANVPVASAREIPNSATTGFTGAQVITTAVPQFVQVQFELTWAVPQGTVAGDTIRQLLPPALDELSFQPFLVFDSDGEILATATLEREPGAVGSAGDAWLVFTFEERIEDGGDGASGTASLGLLIDQNAIDVSDGDTEIIVFDTPVTVRPVVRPPGIRKTGRWNPNRLTATQLDENGRLIQPDSHHTWSVLISLDTSASSDDDWTTASFVDPPRNGFDINCTRNTGPYLNGFKLQLFENDRWRDVERPPAPGEGQITAADCVLGGASSVSLTKSSEDTDRQYRVTYFTDLTTLDGRPVFEEGGQQIIGFNSSYVNVAEVTVGDRQRDVSIEIRGQRAVAEGELANRAAIDIEKYSGTWEGVEFGQDGLPLVTPFPDFEPINQPVEDFDEGPGLELDPVTSAQVTFTVTNIGSERLVDFEITDVVSDGPAVQNLSCNFPDGSTGTTWPGPLSRTLSFDCTGELPPLGVARSHNNIATVTASGQITAAAVTDSDAWNAFEIISAVDIEKFSGTWDGVVFDGLTPQLDAAGQPVPQPTGDFDADFLFVPLGRDVPVQFVVTNIGTERLLDLDVTDATSSGPAITGLSCSFPDGSTGTAWAGPLESFDSFPCAGTMPGLPDTTPHRNDATIEAVGEDSGRTVSDVDSWGASDIIPAIDIEKFSGTWGGVVFDAAGAVLDATGQPVPQPTDDFDTGSLEVPVGAPVPVSFVISNVGPEPLADIEVGNRILEGPGIDGIDCVFPDGSTGLTWPGPLPLQASFNCTGTLPAFATVFKHAGLGLVDAVGANSGLATSDEDRWAARTPIPIFPEIDIEKFSGTWDGVVFDEDGFPALDVNGQPVPQPTDDFDTGALLVRPANVTPVRIIVTNDGTEDLVDVVVSNRTVAGPEFFGLTCTFPDGSTGLTWAGPFVPQQAFECSSISPALANPELHRGIASVSAVGVESDEQVDDDDAWAVEAIAPLVDIEKFSGTWDGVVFVDGVPTFDEDGQPLPQPTQDFDSGSLLVRLDETVTVRYVITNTGPEPLVSLLVGTELLRGPNVTGLDCTFPDGSNGLEWDGPLPIGASFLCTATSPAIDRPEAHIGQGVIRGVGERSRALVTDADQWSVRAVVATIDIEKYSGTWDGVQVDDENQVVLDDDGQPSPQPTGDFDTGFLDVPLGEAVSVTLTVTNTSTGPLRNVVVSDDASVGASFGDLSCVFPDGSTGLTWAGPLGPRETFDCTGTLPASSTGFTHVDDATVTAEFVAAGGVVTVTDTDRWSASAPDVEPPTTITLPQTGGGSGSRTTAGWALLSLVLGAAAMVLASRRRQAA